METEKKLVILDTSTARAYIIDAPDEGMSDEVIESEIERVTGARIGNCDWAFVENIYTCTAAGGCDFPNSKDEFGAHY